MVRGRRHARLAGTKWTSTPTSKIRWRNSRKKRLATPSSVGTPSAIMPNRERRRISTCSYRRRATTSSELGVRWSGSELPRAWWPPSGTRSVYLGVPPVRVDILRNADGIDDVDATLGRVVHASFGDLTVPILALDDLVTNKTAAGRPQDLADVALSRRCAAENLPGRDCRKTCSSWVGLSFGLPANRRGSDVAFDEPAGSTPRR